MLRLTSMFTYVLSLLNICYGPLLVTYNCNYFLLHNFTSIFPEAVEFIKLLFLYLKQNCKMGHFNKRIG